MILLCVHVGHRKSWQIFKYKERVEILHYTNVLPTLMRILRCVLCPRTRRFLFSLFKRKCTTDNRQFASRFSMKQIPINLSLFWMDFCCLHFKIKEKLECLKSLGIWNQITIILEKFWLWFWKVKINYNIAKFHDFQFYLCNFLEYLMEIFKKVGKLIFYLVEKNDIFLFFHKIHAFHFTLYKIYPHALKHLKARQADAFHANRSSIY